MYVGFVSSEVLRKCYSPGNGDVIDTRATIEYYNIW